MPRTYVPIPAAGRLRLPAAIIHPDDALPGTWRVMERWSYRGQHGAYLQRVPQTYSRAHDVSWAQIVYRATAPRRRTAHIGNAIGRATDWQACSITAWELMKNAEREAYYTERGIDILARDAAARAAAPAARPVSVPQEVPSRPPEPLSAPPAPGIDRARWLGQQITAMMPRTKWLGWSAHARRRYAARQALAKAAGYEASDPDSDARILLAPASLELQALNEYAGRVFSGQEDSDAVL